MKKIYSLILVLGLAFTLTACGGGGGSSATVQAPQEVFQDFQQKLKLLETSASSEISTTIDMTMAMGEEKLEMSIDLYIQQIVRSATDIDMFMQMAMDQAGTAINMDLWYTGGYMYMNAQGEKIKSALPIDTVLEQYGGANNIMQMLSEEDIASATSAEGENGTTAVTFTLNDTGAAKIMSTVTGIATNEDTALELTNATYTYVFDANGIPLSANIDMSMALTISAQKVTCTIQATADYIDFNHLTAIDFPEDLDTYTEYAA